MVRSGDKDEALLPAKMDSTQHPVSQNSGNTFLKIKLHLLIFIQNRILISFGSAINFDLIRREGRFMQNQTNPKPKTGEIFSYKN